MFSFSFVFSDWVFGYLSSCQLLTFKAVFCEEKLLCILNGVPTEMHYDVDYIHLGFCIFELILNIIMYVVKLTLHNIRSSMQNRHTQWKYKFFGLIYIECPFLVIALDNPIFGTMMSNQEKQLFEHFCFEFYAIWCELDMKSDVVCCRGWPESKSNDFVEKFNLNMANENSRLDLSQEGLYFNLLNKIYSFWHCKHLSTKI